MYFLQKLGLVEDDDAAPSRPSTPPTLSYRDIQLSDAVKTKTNWWKAITPSPERPSIEAVEIRVPDDPSNKFALLLRNVLSPEEVQMLIDLTESIGYIRAIVIVDVLSDNISEDYYREYRCIVDSDELAAQLWERIQPFAPAVYRSRRAVGINERFRFLRYNPGDTHHQHRDRSYVRGLEKGPEHEGEVSMITVQIYLNGVEEGGVTNIYNARDQDKLLPLVPEPGSVFLFEHDILHDEDIVVKGRKYAVCSEVMYSAKEV